MANATRSVEVMQQPRKKLIRLITVPMSFNLILRNQLGFLNEHYEVVAVSSPGEELAELSERERVGVRSVAMTRSITPLQDLKAIWQLYKLFKKERPDIIHTQTTKAGLLGMTAGWLAGVPLRMHTVNALPLLRTKGVKRSILGMSEKWTYRMAHHVYANSFGLQELLVAEKLCVPNKTKVIANGSSNGIDINHFDPALITDEEKNKLRASLNITDTDIVLCFIGRLVTDKGINELVQAFVRLHKELPHAKLLLVGWMEEHLNPLIPAIKQLIETHPAIITTGYQKDVRPYFAISHALVFPSHREGFPNVPMQAGAMGIPGIVTNINGCNEIIEDGKNGMIIPTRDEQAIYDAMRKMTVDQEYYRSLLPWCRSMILSRFDQQEVWGALLKEYAYLCEGK